jgi:release factor glutamine methyltransferase
MNLLKLYNQGKKKLAEGGCENASFDAMHLLLHITHLTKSDIYLAENSKVDDETVVIYNQYLSRRISGEPLQYILKVWDFMGLEYAVGPGVLIPRPETELLVEISVPEVNRRKGTVVFDLCAGTGCIGISIANHCKHSKVFMLEYSESALNYLYVNVKKHDFQNAIPLTGDVLNGFECFNLPQPDIIISNPPYVPSDEIDSLQQEISYEPRGALDGGIEGLDYYGSIKELWFPYLLPDGVLLFECGENQAEIIASMFFDMQCRIDVFCDLNKVQRVVKISKVII